jgi:hypothetical protein
MPGQTGVEEILGRKDLKENTLKKVSIYEECTGEKVPVSDFPPHVSSDYMSEINEHMEECGGCRETYNLGLK